MAWVMNEAFDYCFPRPLSVDDRKPAVEGGERTPLVIVGGGREVEQDGFDFYVGDDGSLNKKVVDAMKNLLPGLFPGKYHEGLEPEWAWVSIYLIAFILDEILTALMRHHCSRASPELRGSETHSSV